MSEYYRGRTWGFVIVYFNTTVVAVICCSYCCVSVCLALRWEEGFSLFARFFYYCTILCRFSRALEGLGVCSCLLFLLFLRLCLCWLVMFEGRILVYFLLVILFSFSCGRCHEYREEGLVFVHYFGCFCGCVCVYLSVMLEGRILLYFFLVILFSFSYGRCHE